MDAERFAAGPSGLVAARGEAARAGPRERGSDLAPRQRCFHRIAVIFESSQSVVAT